MLQLACTQLLSLDYFSRCGAMWWCHCCLFTLILLLFNLFLVEVLGTCTRTSANCYKQATRAHETQLCQTTCHHQQSGVCSGRSKLELVIEHGWKQEVWKNERRWYQLSLTSWQLETIRVIRVYNWCTWALREPGINGGSDNCESIMRWIFIPSCTTLNKWQKLS